MNTCVQKNNEQLLWYLLMEEGILREAEASFMAMNILTHVQGCVLRIFGKFRLKVEVWVQTA